MKKTSLYETHKKSGGKMVNFAGWMMPVQYTGIRKEHKAVRSCAGIFDVSHMGELEVTGEKAAVFCQWVTTNDIDKLRNGKAQYTLLCNEKGGVVDDIIIYKFGANHFFICVNASNTDKAYDWLLEKSKDFDVKVINSSNKFSQLAVQGPKAIEILNIVFGEKLNLISRFSFGKLKFRNFEVIAARTGYTGEDGFELFSPWSEAETLWNKIIEVGSEFGLLPCGLGARDTLRVEMGYSLYGHEIDEDISPIEAGLNRYVKFDKGDFLGRDILFNQFENGLGRKVVGFKMNERGIPREGYKLYNFDDNIGLVTSGTFSPSLEIGLGIGLVNSKNSLDEFEVEIRGEKRGALATGFPFYKK